MNGTTKHVGLDAHRATTLVAGRDACGRLIAQTVFPTEVRPPMDLFRGMRGASRGPVPASV